MRWLRNLRIQRLQVELAQLAAQDKAAREVYGAIGECSPVFLIRLAGKMAALRERIAQLQPPKP